MKSVILLRHADIDMVSSPVTNDTPLSSAGKARAEALAHALQSAGVGAVYVSLAKRTQMTAAPAAVAAGLSALVLGSPKELAQQVTASPPDFVTLVVGHSNTVPGLIEALGATSPVTIVQGHDDLFVATLQDDGVANVLRLKYGVASNA